MISDMLTPKWTRSDASPILNVNLPSRSAVQFSRDGFSNHMSHMSYRPPAIRSFTIAISHLVSHSRVASVSG
jgi:hypothetical protein